jgi:hypothetical protein
MQGAVSRQGRDEQAPTEQRHQGMGLALEPLRKGNASNFDMMLSLG